MMKFTTGGDRQTTFLVEKKCLSTFISGEDYISIFHEVTNDVLLLNSVAEPEENSEGGLLDNILTGNGYKFEAKDYDQLHGWVVRGDLNDPEVKIDVEDAVMRALQFALEHKDL